MNTQPSFIKKAVAQIAHNRTKRAFDRSIMHPERDWFIGVGFFLLLVGVGAVWNMVNYQRFTKVSLLEGDGSVVPSVYMGGVVEAALLEVEARQEKYEALKASMKEQTGYVAPREREEEVGVSAVEIGTEESAAEVQNLETMSVVELVI